MKPIYTDAQGRCVVLDEDHPANTDGTQVVSYVKQTAQGQWIVWQKGAQHMDYLTPTGIQADL